MELPERISSVCPFILKTEFRDGKGVLVEANWARLEIPSPSSFHFSSTELKYEVFTVVQYLKFKDSSDWNELNTY